jgi:hypothetical protein
MSLSSELHSSSYSANHGLQVQGQTSVILSALMYGSVTIQKQNRKLKSITAFGSCACLAALGSMGKSVCTLAERRIPGKAPCWQSLLNATKSSERKVGN